MKKGNKPFLNGYNFLEPGISDFFENNFINKGKQSKSFNWKIIKMCKQPFSLEFIHQILGCPRLTLAISQIAIG